MNDRIQEIKDRFAAITPGTWQEHMHTDVDDPESCYRSIKAGLGYYGRGKEAPVGFDLTGYIRPEDSAFIASAPDDIAYLLSEVERLQEENKVMKSVLEWYATMGEREELRYSDNGTRARTALSHLKG